MNSLAPVIAKIICAKAVGGFCKNVGGHIGCKVGRGTSDYNQCVANIDQHVLAGHLSTAEEIEKVIKCS